jgi:hypothetical protein
MSSTENEDLHQRYSSLHELYQKVLKEKEDALEETERATISFARHFDSEVCWDISIGLESAIFCILIRCYYRKET